MHIIILQYSPALLIYTVKHFGTFCMSSNLRNVHKVVTSKKNSGSI